MPFHKTVMILPSTRMALASRSDSPAPSILIPHWTSSLAFLFFSARFLERRVVAFEQREALRACFLLGSHLGSLLSHEPQYQPLTIEAQQKRKPKVLSRRAVYQFVEKRTLIRCRLEKAGREGRGSVFDVPRRRHSYHSSHHGYSSSYKHSHSKREHRHTHHHRLWLSLWFMRSHRAHSRRHGTTSYSHKNSHYSHNDDSEKDDSIGHFLGGEGDIIGGKCTLR